MFLLSEGGDAVTPAFNVASIALPAGQIALPTPPLALHALCPDSSLLTGSGAHSLLIRWGGAERTDATLLPLSRPAVGDASLADGSDEAVASLMPGTQLAHGASPAASSSVGAYDGAWLERSPLLKGGAGLKLAPPKLAS